MQLRKAINLIETGKVYKKELDLSNNKIILLENRLILKDSIIAKYQSKDKIWSKLESDYKSETSNFKNYANNTQKIYDRQKTLLFLSKFGKWAYLGIGIGAGILLSK